MRYELEPMQFALRIYDQHEDNYVAVATIRTYGDRAWISGISSPRLFDMFDKLPELMARLQVKSLEGYMTDTMARAMRIASHGRARVDTREEGECSGRTMTWIRVEAL